MKNRFGYKKRKLKKCRQKRSERKAVKGAFTVEAAFVVPVFLLMTLGGINLGYRLFQEARSACEIHKDIKEFDPVSVVRNLTFVKGQAS